MALSKLQILNRYKGDAKAAYGAWLRNYIDGHINIYQYVVDKSKTSGINLSTDETIKLLKGQTISTPAPKISTTTNNQQVTNVSTIENLNLKLELIFPKPQQIMLEEIISGITL